MTKDADTIKRLISMGESYTFQFKRDFIGQDRIADEIVAFANSKGGSIVIGVDDKTGEVVGLDYKQIQSISNQIGSAANEKVRPIIYIETYPIEIDGKQVLVADVATGINKPYKNLRGEIYVKQGPDKRRIIENREILRLFQESRQYFPDEEPVFGSSHEDIYDKALDRFLQKGYGKSKNDFGIPLPSLLKNLRIVSDNEDQLTLAGLLFFAEHPELRRPQFIIKAVAFIGNSLGGSQYRDSRDIAGDMVYVYEEALRFCDGNLRHIQAGQSFNSLGVLEVSRIALEELIQNSLTHRSYLVDAPIRLLIFDDRIEIINPGALAGKLTVENIKLGEAYQRNPLLASLCARGMTYRGLGSGIVRALMDGANIEFVNNEETDTFKAIVYRNTQPSLAGNKETEEGSNESSESGKKATDFILNLLKDQTQKCGFETNKCGFGADKSSNILTGLTEQFGLEPSTLGHKIEIIASKCGLNPNLYGLRVAEYALGNSKCGLGLNETLTIALMHELPKIKLKEISDALNMSSRYIDKLVARLKSKGLLEKVGGKRYGEWHTLI